ncbi:hypothetical protein [Erythrobacter rubeus]|uniref:Uncharacterized protein n=1 Tax=Erythrobacter rubeus TaxID=2760803 RepID=A0ABR8KTB1_9SPHN|nr:hypothetical protein [Erythrobacter rubeus]MBD2842677.1 hypothetical protein [Erythrobacter rubeus]
MSAPTRTRIATEEFHRRLTICKRKALAKEWKRDVANHRARLWLAIAAAFDCDLPQREVECIWPAGAKSQLRAWEIADPDEYRAELARARDVAVRAWLTDRNDLAKLQRCWDLQGLAVALGCEATTVIEPIAPDPRLMKEAA